MDIFVERCCGLDVHRSSIVACLLTGRAGTSPTREIRRFGTMSHDLRELRGWLEASACTHVGMESTGVYWMPVYKALEGHFEQVVGNAYHLAKVPGRKTDVLDSEWLADLLRHGLIKNSFIPGQAIRELRDLTRYRCKLVQSRTSERNRLQKLLETANIKLASVMSDVFGVSGMSILRALVNGESRPEVLAELAKGRLRQKLPLLKQALDSGLDEHQRRLLGTQLRRLDRLDEDIADIEKQLDIKLDPYREEYERLMQIPGVSRVVASVIIAEMGVEMSVFKDAKACAAWAGVCPGNNQSAEKHRRTRTREGNPHLKTALVEAAHAASRVKGTYLREKFHRIRARRGYKKAAMAVAHRILTAAYHMLAKGEDYRELGADYLDKKNRDGIAKKLVKRLENLGFRVELAPIESAVAARTKQVAHLPVCDEATTGSEVGLVMAGGEQGPGTELESRTTHKAEEGCCSEQTTDSMEPTPPSHDGPEEKAAPATEPPAIGAALGESDADGTDAKPQEPVSSQDESALDSGPSDRATANGDGPRTARTEAHLRTSFHAPASRRGCAEFTGAGGRTKARGQAKRRDPRLPPAGTILERIYEGVEYRVRVLEAGFEYQGAVYATISRVAREIAGSKRNGYVFFRLNGSQPKENSR